MLEVGKCGMDTGICRRQNIEAFFASCKKLILKNFKKATVDRVSFSIELLFLKFDT